MGRGIKERELMMSRVVRETFDQRGASGDSACVRTVVELLKLIESIAVELDCRVMKYLGNVSRDWAVAARPSCGSGVGR